MSYSFSDRNPSQKKGCPKNGEMRKANFINPFQLVIHSKSTQIKTGRHSSLLNNITFVGKKEQNQ